MKRLHVLLAVLGATIAVALLKPYRTPPFAPVVHRLKGERTVGDRVTQYGEAAWARLRPRLAAARVNWPPERLCLVGLKDEERLEVYAQQSGEWCCVTAYPFTANSGNLGPKLRYGDGQIPEGVYRVESLNPNSAYHLSLRLNYPNEFDRRQGEADGREDLGRDIMIHGGAASVGCIAIGDPAIEEVFTLVARLGCENVDVILAPVDFRVRDLPLDSDTLPPWTGELYAAVRRELSKLPLPGTM